MTFAEKAYDIFSDATSSYHVADHVDAPSSNPHPEGSIEAVLWAKNYIDVVQWHLEDIIRDPDIDPVEALAIKRRRQIQSRPHRHGGGARHILPL